MIDLLFPETVGIWPFIALIVISATTSFLTAAAGIGGGIVLLVIMASLVPAPAVIPVHGAVQIGSNVGRTAIMAANVSWKVLGPFLVGSMIGAGLGGLTAVQLPTGVLKTGLALFVLYAVWGPPIIAQSGRLAIIGTGIFSSFLTMFFGATGTFVSAMVKRLKLGRLEHVATHSACMVAQHAVKVSVFGLLGFNFAPWAGLILAMIVSGFVGTVLGKRLLVRMNDRLFHQVLAVVLTVLALRLLWDGIQMLAQTG
jgi:uncharacterized membrane protein YfcA